MAERAEHPVLRGRRLLRVTGTSMLPTLAPGDLVLVDAREGGTVSVGELVVARSSGGDLVVHRVCEVRAEGRVRLRGDALDQPDEQLLAATAVIGRVTQVLAGSRPSGAGAEHVRAGAVVERGPGSAVLALGSGLARRLATLRPLRRALVALTGVALRYSDFRGDGAEIVVHHRGVEVARLYPDTGRMWARFPYTFLIEPPRRRRG